jgi:hypothetical protein
MGTTSWVVPGPQTIDVPQVSAVRVQLIGGRAEVAVWDSPEVRVEVRGVSGHPLEVRLEGDRLTVGYPFLGWDGWLKRLHSYRAKDTADVRVLLPPATGVKVGTALADVSVAGVHENVSVGTASGSVRVEGVRGVADVRAVSGGVTVTRHDGAVRVNTVSGAVTVDGALPRVEASTVSGALSVTTTLATSVMSVNAVSAGIGVVLPAGSGLVLTARTVSGKVLVDSVDRRTPGVTSVQEQSDETGCWLTVNSVSGNVEVRRAQP